MKRSTLLTLTLVTLLALTAAPALAGKKSQKNNQNQDQQQSQQSNQQQRRFKVQSLLNGQPNWQQIFKKHKPHQDPSPTTPIDPGNGAGGSPVTEPVVEPVTPPSRPGYVWVNGHWERAKAPKQPTMIVDPIPTQGGPVVRDHRDGIGANGGVTVTTTQGGPIVRDHRKSTTIFNPTGGKTWTVAPTVRDHRTITPPPLASGQGGGVTVTTTPGGGTRDNAITGGGPNPLELLAEGAAKVGNVFGIGYGEVTSGNGSAPSGPTIRDHRTPAPVVRDHRSK
jgi:hypothetical protein